MKIYFISLFLAFTVLMSVGAQSQEPACEWSDGVRSDRSAILVEGNCTLDDILESDFISDSPNGVIILEPLFVLPYSTFTINGVTTKNIFLRSEPQSYAYIVAEGSTLEILNASISSIDLTSGRPDESIGDGRAFIRVDAFVGDEGSLHNAHVEIKDSSISYLGYNSLQRDGNFSTYGLSLKVRRETELDQVKVTGSIINSVLDHNFRGFYSYGARDVIFERNFVHNNHDYGVDPHDDSDGFVARFNRIVNNGGTGLALSRRCSNSIISNNYIAGNKNNGIIIHDLSNSIIVSDNIVQENGLDGIVIHDSHNVSVVNNQIRFNRNGIRVFAGSTLTSINHNIFDSNARSAIFILNGNLDAVNDYGDYSVGTTWNAQNISRHSDSRVRIVSVSNNQFSGDTVIDVSEADYVEYIENIYRNDVMFNIQNSKNVRLDGDRALGNVSYRLRADDSGSTLYEITPKENSELSFMGQDKIMLANGVYFPADNQNFTLELNASGDNLISAASAIGNIQTGIMKFVPLNVVEGSVTLSSYIGDLSVTNSATLEIVSTDWAEVFFSLDYGQCALFNIVIEDRYIRSFSESSFFIEAGASFQLGSVLAAGRGRAVLELSCVN